MRQVWKGHRGYEVQHGQLYIQEKADKQIKYYCCYNHMRVAQLEEEAAKQAKKLAQRKAGNK